MASRKKKQEKPPITVHSLALTPQARETLDTLSRDIADYSGRKVSGSAVLRALLMHARKQGYDWAIAELVPLVEAEQAGGIKWGRW
jgi:hypothetical protein